MTVIIEIAEVNVNFSNIFHVDKFSFIPWYTDNPYPIHAIIVAIAIPIICSVFRIAIPP